MATEAEIVSISNDLEATIAERERVQKQLTEMGGKQSALAQQLGDLNRRVTKLKQDLKQAL